MPKSLELAGQVFTTMEKAHEMLKSGKYRVNEVPEKIGMKDMDNFREKYKKYFGKTPVDTIKNV